MPICYSVIMSDHNLPEYQACIDLKPAVVLVIASTEYVKPGERFQRQLTERCPEMEVVLIGGKADERLEGNDASEIQAWLAATFAAYYLFYQSMGYSMSLNLTGGTKIMSLLLKESFEWTNFHYQAEKLGYLQVLTPKSFTEQVTQIPYQNEVPPLEHSRLYNERVNIVPENPLYAHAKALVLADYFMQAQLLTLEHKPAWHPWLALTSFLDESGIWEDRRNALSGEVTWQELCRNKVVGGMASNPGEPELPLLEERKARLIVLFECLNELHPVITWDETGVILPLPSGRKKDRVLEHWMRFLAGGWYERLIMAWLDQTFPDSPRKANVQVSDANASGQRELDILMVLKRRLWVLEVKADLPPQHRASSASDQLSSAARPLGRVGRMLVLSPQFVSRMRSADARRAFSLNCRAENVLCCLASSPERLAWSLNSGKNLLSDDDFQKFEAESRKAASPSP
jgi:hypothetical protein